MPTNYIKNFDHEQFQDLYKKMCGACAEQKPLWKGTVYIGKKPLYIECHVKWLADKIEDYFFKTLPNEHLKNAKELYILNSGVSGFMPGLDAWTTNVFWTDDNIYRCSDLIAHFNCIFGRWGNTYIISEDNDILSNFYHLGENHLLMRLFRYIFDNDDSIVLHGAVVGNDKNGVLITGLSGAGKSTLAAYCLKQGLKFVSDDRISLHKENGEVFANPIYTTLSLTEQIDGLKIQSVSKPLGCTKNIFVLDKSQISENMKISAIIEPVKQDAETAVISKVAKAPVLTRICSDYSNFSLLTRSTNPISDYKKIANLFSNVDTFSLQLSKSVEDNAHAILNFINQGEINV
jgi:hypothetical protein